MNTTAIPKSAHVTRSMRETIAAEFRAWYWLLSIVLIVASLTLGFIGFRIQLGAEASTLDALYKTFKTINLSADVTSPVPWQLEVARFATPLLFANALIVGLGALFWERFNLFRLLWWRNHVVICGLGKKAELLAKDFRKANRRVVVIDNVRQNTHRDEFRFRGIVLLVGDARDEVLLRRAGIARAKYVLALTGDDGSNAQIAAVCRAMSSQTRKFPATCFAHIVDLDLCRFLREHEVESTSASPFRVDYFSIYEIGARQLLAKHPFTGQDLSSPPPHVVVVGPGRFGASLILQATREWRNAGGTETNKLRVTVIDRAGPENLERLRTRYPQVNAICDFTVLALDTLSPEFSRATFLFDENGHCDVSAIYITIDDDSASLTAAFALNRRLEHMGDVAPIVVRMSEGSGFAAIFSEDATTAIRGFHLLDETCLPGRLCVSTNERIARALHSDYLDKNRERKMKTATDPSLAQWEQLPEYLRESNRRQATHLAQRLRATGYQIAPLTDWNAEHYEFAAEEIERMAALEHERWCEQLRGEGFKYAAGPKTRNTHPSFQPWDKLDGQAKQTAREIVSAAPRVLALVGFQIEKAIQRPAQKS
ncbi:MAG: NAD(P)-binding protein [Candidatus Hydrogenedentes bacterium]|nr:NAD(P)-binding protein [Candidatus Hydrogenedentota bacterium]